MKSMINKMLKKAGLMVYNLFTRWKLDCFTDAAKRREILRNRKLNAMVDCLQKRRTKNLKAGFSKTAGDAMNTEARKKIVNRLAWTYYGRLKSAFVAWKSDTFAKFKAEIERKKAKVIDEFTRQCMSPFQKAFLKWSRFMRNANKMEFGNQIKAGFTLTNLLTRYLRDNKEKYLRLGMRRIAYNEDKVMSSAFAKMLRAAGANLNTAWLSWKMATMMGNSAKMALAKRNLAAKNIADVLDKKRKRHLRSGVRPLADGVASTKT